MRRICALQARYVASPTHRDFNPINISSATKISRSMSSPTPLTRPASTYTVSMTARAISGRSHLPFSTRLRASGASSLLPPSSSHPCRKSGCSRTRPAAGDALEGYIVRTTARVAVPAN